MLSSPISRITGTISLQPNLAQNIDPWVEEIQKGAIEGHILWVIMMQEKVLQ